MRPLEKPQDAERPSELEHAERNSILSLMRAIHSSAVSIEARLAPLAAQGAISEHRPAGDGTSARARARQLYHLRRRRDAVLGQELFGEPVWDLLLDLFIAQSEGRKTCISNACIAAAVPATTALRWIRELEGRDLLQREQDPDDARRAFLRLSPVMFEKMRELLSR